MRSISDNFRGGVTRTLSQGLSCAGLLACMLLPSGSVSAAVREDFHDLIRRQFEIYDPDYVAHLHRYGARLETVAQALSEAQAKGKNLHCSQQLFLEAKWLYEYTAHWKRLDDKLTRIEQSLRDDDQGFAARQMPTNGWWGACYEEWFMRLGATLDGLDDLASRGEHPRYRIHSSGAFDTGKKLLSRLQDLLISDIANTGIDHRGELSSLVTTFSRAAFKPRLRDVLLTSLDEGMASRWNFLTEAFRYFLRGAQDTSTGYWGAWYIVQGKVHKSTDLSMTYHIVAYSEGHVDRWPQIIATTADSESDEYPYGWRHDGHYNNHNLYDVAAIYKHGWPYMSESQRDTARRQIRAMLEWSLANTIGADGEFVYDPTFSDSLADEYYFGVSFLDVVGYWQPKSRFWGSGPIDGNPTAACCRLKQELGKLGLDGWAAEGAMQRLERSCERC